MSFTLPLPRLLAEESVPVLRWGVIGTSIAGSFVGALQAHTAQRVVAVAARTCQDRSVRSRTSIATVHQIRRRFRGSLRRCGVRGDTAHAAPRSGVEAIAAGKHVLIEKPIAMSADEARAITDAGRAAGVLVMEAMWTRYLPQADIIRQVLAADMLGEVRLVRADFGFVMPFEPRHRLWNPQLGGGALLDAGVYPISFVSSVLGAPTVVTAVGSLASTGVDERADLLLSTASGATAVASTSLVTSLPVTASIFGSAGRLDVLSPFFGPSGVTLTTGSLLAEESTTWRDDTFATLHEALCYQASYLASYVAQGRVESPLHDHRETVSVMATIDEARRQIAAAEISIAD